MALTFSHKYIKNTSTCGTVLTEHLLNAGRRPQTPKRARKSPHNWVGQKKKGKKKKREREKGIRTGPAPQRRSRERGKVCVPWEVPSLAGQSARMEGELWSLRGEHSNWFMEGKAERDLHRWQVSLPCTPQPEMLTCWGWQGLGAEAWVLEVRPRERTGVGFVETA